ncbi:hypothetical protein IMPR6_310067 [Imperialibacter sp. EC-SDR9]|nr:hypothetical protein IMPERIA89_210002 [Imperialibacter sp. 89]CAD5256128.1 hypothetical protein IMPERIA75_210002 [Imperialibacter sp. 75]VVT20577.1 hypothetical protein IMPR6_310067 [Imperialibacter sp. EC-SDR9]
MPYSGSGGGLYDADKLINKKVVPTTVAGGTTPFRLQKFSKMQKRQTLLEVSISS